MTFLHTSDSSSISIYLSLAVFTGPILMFFLDLMYFTPNMITIIATTDRIIIATNRPLQRIFFSLPFESLQIHLSEVLSVMQGSLESSRVLLASRKDDRENRLSDWVTLWVALWVQCSVDTHH